MSLELSVWFVKGILEGRQSDTFHLAMRNISVSKLQVKKMQIFNILLLDSSRPIDISIIVTSSAILDMYFDSSFTIMDVEYFPRLIHIGLEKFSGI